MITLMVLTAVAALASVVVLPRRMTGMALRVIQVGKDPGDIAIDPLRRRVFVLNADEASVSVLDADTAMLLRTVSVGQGQLGGASIVVDEQAGRVLVTKAQASDDTISLLDAATGQLRQIVHGPYGTARIVVDERNGHAFIPAGVVGVLDTHTGQLHTVPVTQTGVTAISLPMAVDQHSGRVFAINDAAPTPSVSVYDAGGGALVQTIDVDIHPAAIAVDGRTSHAFIVTADDDSVRMLDAHTGRLLKTVTLRNTPIGMVVDEQNGHLIVTTSAGEVVILDTTTGALRHMVTVDSRMNINAVALDPQRERLIVFTSIGTEVLSAGTGTRLCTIDNGEHAPVAAAVDSRTGHVFVVNRDNLVRVPDSWSWLPQAIRQQLPFLPRPTDRLQMPPGSVTVLDPSCHGGHA